MLLQCLKHFCRPCFDVQAWWRCALPHTGPVTLAWGDLPRHSYGLGPRRVALTAVCVRTASVCLQKSRKCK